VKDRTASLVTVACNETYIAQTYELFDSAILRFLPGMETQKLRLPGIVGPWPMSTITRPKIILNNWEKITGDYVYCCDADMLIAGEVGTEILGELVAVEHPGYVGYHCTTVPYDRNPLSATCIGMGAGERYYAGGFFGGERDAVRDLLFAMESMIDEDAEKGIVPRWHDESALNAALAQSPPTVVLSPEYCYPETSGYYEQEVWKQPYERRIVALDKAASQRGDR
jgi:histo-blood group ABO system transferase